MKNGEPSKLVTNTDNSNFSINILKGINKIKNIRNDIEVMRRSVEIREKMKIKILTPKIKDISNSRIFSSNIH